MPVTINYPLVLEGETLIEDYLKEEGKARYIIDDDEFSRLARIVQYTVKIMGLDTSMVVRFGAPMDVFGNRIGSDGSPMAPDGTRVDSVSYLHRDGEVVADVMRDEEYTRQAGLAVASAFLEKP